MEQGQETERVGIDQKPVVINERERKLASAPIPRLVISYAVPAIIGMLVSALYNVVDRYWIGQLDNVDAMSGIGLTLPLSTILLAFMLLIGIGSTATISIRLGQQRKPEAETILANCLTLSAVVGLALTVAGLLFLKPILVAFGASEHTLPYASDYMRIILYGNVFNTIGFTINTAIRGTGNPRRSATTQLLGAILNMFLDPLLILGFNMGVKGAAIATIISQFISAAWVMSYFLGGKGLVKLHTSLLPLRLPVIRQIFAIGVSPFALQLATSLVTIVANRALRQYGGDVAIGAMTVISSIAILCMMPLFGINQGLQPILGYNYGARQYHRVKAAWRFGVWLATAYVLLGFVAVETFPSWIISQFIRDPFLNQVGTFGIRVFLAMLPVIGFQIICTNFFQSIGRAKIALFTSLLRQVIILLPLYLILPELFGLSGIWFAGPAADFLSFLITAALMARELRLLNRLEMQTAHAKQDENHPSPTTG